MEKQIQSTQFPSWLRPIARLVLAGINPISRLLLAAGIPMGPIVLITIRGRKSGLPRTQPLALIDHFGRRGLVSALGEANWVRNLRAAGHATITVRGHKEEVTAVELELTEAVEFIREVYAPFARLVPFREWIVRNLDRIDLDNPEEVAKERPIFELHPR